MVLTNKLQNIGGVDEHLGDFFLFFNVLKNSEHVSTAAASTRLLCLVDFPDRLVVSSAFLDGDETLKSHLLPHLLDGSHPLA